MSVMRMCVHMDYNKWLSARLRQLREQKQVSARDMSLSLLQSESYINKIENGRTAPSMNVFFAICEYLEVTPQEFFSEDIPAPQKARETMVVLNRLTPEQLAHIRLIAEDIAGNE